MSDHQFERAVTDWLEDGTDRTPGRTIDGVLLAIKTTPQERDLRIPWRFPRMLALPRASGIAAVAIVAVVGAGGLIFLNNRAPGETGGPPATPPATPQSTEAPTPEPTPEPTPTPTPEPTPEPSYPGISGWVPYTSEVYGFTVSYPEGWEVWPAEREFKPGGRRDRPTEDVFVAGQPDDLGLSAFLAPAGKGADFESVSGLTAWAEKYCNDTERGDCDTFAVRAVPMCIDVGSDPCKPAILVPSLGAQPDGSESAFIPYWQGVTDTSDPDKVIVFTTGRGDEWQGAVKYGGMVELLKSILSQLDVTEAP